MRAPTLVLSIAFAIAGQLSVVRAQTPAPTAATPEANDDSLSPSTLPKARQSVKEAGSNHIDALSPDEARRLARIRAKATAGKPTRPSPAATAAPATPAPPSAAAPAPQQAATPAPPPPIAAAPADRAPEPAKDTAQAPAAARPEAAAAGTAVPRRARPTRHATRHVRPSQREHADLDARPSRRRASHWRRAWPEVADRAPRVGDVVPPDAPLYGRAYPAFPQSEDYFYAPRRYLMPW